MKRIHLSGSFEYAMVDDDTYTSLMKYWWKIGSNGYAITFGRNGLPHTQKLMHRLIMNAAPFQMVDHIDGNPMNNCRSNLRFVTHSQNNFNSGKRNPELTTSKYKGVRRQRWGYKDRWAATIYADHHRYELGTFASEVEAARAYNKAASQLHGVYARLNDV